MKRVVITGGPCAGKTSIISSIRHEFDSVHIVPEGATILLENGWPPPSSQTDIKWFREFQQGTWDIQIHLENALNFKTGPLAVMDRGILDSAAYWPNGEEDYYREFSTSKAAGYTRYDGVIFLDSLAIYKPSLYSTDNNPQRYDSVTDAQRINASLFEVWKDHPTFLHINNSKSITENIDTVYKFILSVLE